MTDHGPALPRAKSTLYDAGTGIAMIVRPPRDAAIGPRVYDELFSGVDLVPTLLDLLGVDAPADIDGISHADNLRHGQTSPDAHRGLHHEDVPRFVRSDPRGPHQGIQLHRELRGAAAARSAVGHRRKRARPDCRATGAGATSRARTLRPHTRIRPSRTTCSGPMHPTRPRPSRTTSRCCSTTGARRPTTSSRRSSRVPELRSATPRLTCEFTDHRSPAGRPSHPNAASRTSRPPDNSFRHGDC